jgi:hypothetical protein
MPQQNRVPGAPDRMFEDQRIAEPEAAQLRLDGVVMRAREEALGRLLVLPAGAREIDRDGLREDDFVPAVTLRGNEGERAGLDLGEHAVDEARHAMAPPALPQPEEIPSLARPGVAWSRHGDRFASDRVAQVSNRVLDGQQDIVAQMSHRENGSW